MTPIPEAPASSPRDAQEAAWRDGLRRADAAVLAQIHRAYAGDVLGHLQRGFGYVDGGERRFMRGVGAFDAEEMCQEAFLRFFEQVQAGNFQVDRPVRPYLLRIAANLALKRGGRGAREVLLEEPPEIAVAPLSPETARLLAEFRATLPPEDEAVVREWFDENVSQEAAGEALGLSRDQVYRAIRRVRTAAFRFFGARGWFDDA